MFSRICSANCRRTGPVRVADTERVRQTLPELCQLDNGVWIAIIIIVISIRIGVNVAAIWPSAGDRINRSARIADDEGVKIQTELKYLMKQRLYFPISWTDLFFSMLTYLTYVVSTRTDLDCATASSHASRLKVGAVLWRSISTVYSNCKSNKGFNHLVVTKFRQN